MFIPGPVELDWLERATAHYHACLLRTPHAQDYLKSRGLTSPEVATTLRLGFVDGSLLRILSSEGREALKRVGVLNERGGEMMFGCVVFPLVQPATNQVINLYGRNCLQSERLNTSAARHLYLPGERRGIFNPQGAQNTEEVIITESVIDAAALWSVGLRSVVPAYGVTGLTDEIVSHLIDCRVKRVALMLDTDEAGKGAALEMQARLVQSNITSRVVELPAKDASEYIAQGGTTYDIALANELAKEVLGQALDELAPPVRGLYRELQKVYRQQAEKLKCKVEDVQLSRREIREATNWSDWQVRAYCQKLVEMEYLFAITNGNGKPAVYQLARSSDDDHAQTLRGLTDIEELKKRLREKQSLDHDRDRNNKDLNDKDEKK